MPSADRTGGQGGTQPAPQNAPGALAGAAVQPGVQRNIVIANVVLVFGSAQSVVGVFIYTPGTTPAAGNGPVLSLTAGTKDPFGNTVQPGFTSYVAGGEFTNLYQGQLNFASGAAGSIPGLIGAGLGYLFVSSGAVGASDSAAQIIMQSASASGTGQSFQASNAQTVQLNSSASASIPVSSAGVTTVAQVLTMLRSAGICT